MMKIVFHVVLLLGVASSPARSLSVIMFDGSVLKGDLMTESADTVTIRTTFGSMGLARRDILYADSDSATASGDPAVLQTSFGQKQDLAAAALIREILGDGAADAYSAMNDSEKADFLDRLWSRKSPLLLKYYYGYHLGRRLYTISPAYFERDNLIPNRYRSDFVAPHPDEVGKAAEYLNTLLDQNPNDAVALCAKGYLQLELDQIDEARDLFIRALKRNRRLVEARNGRALSHLKMHHQKAKALQIFRETVAMDRSYVGAHYGMGMCHIAMMGQDRVGLDDYFGKVVEIDPNHADAYFKLGAFNEALRRTKRAAEAYSRQLTVNPNHKRASERLALVSMALRSQGEALLTHEDLVRLSEKNGGTYLPLLAESCLDRQDYVEAERAFDLYLQSISGEERRFYDDLSLIADPETVNAIETAYPRQERERLRRQFWVLADPTPTTPANERRIEHYRRVYHARTHYTDGLDRLSGLGWDRRGDIFVRFGKPDHQSWSDFLVFETDPAVARVKSRINNLAHSGLEEIVPPHQMGGSFTGSMDALVSGEIRGIPTFPLPRRTTLTGEGVETGYVWESWIYGKVGGGIEVTFIDEIGKGFYEFARIPPESPNRILWQAMAPATIVGKIVSREPSIYAYDYGGNPIDLFVTSAAFRGSGGGTELEVYVGVPVSQIRSESTTTAVVEREVAFFDRDWNLARRVTERISHPIGGDQDEGLMIDQIDTRLPPGDYFLAVQIRQPETGAIQILKEPVRVPSYRQTGRATLSDLEVAGRISDAAPNEAGKFVKGDLEVVPLPMRTVSAGSPITLYFEIYDLTRDTFGRTHYRIDYEVDTSGEITIASALGKLVGRGPEGSSSRVSYDHTGDAPDEQIHVNLTIPESEGTDLRVTVSVTDLNAADTTAAGTADVSSARSLRLKVVP